MKEFERLDIEIYKEDIDRCHRTGSAYEDKRGKVQKSVLIKFTSWKARDLLYKARKSSRFIVKPDITDRVQKVFDTAKAEVNKVGSVANKLIEFDFVDCNCKLMVRTKTGLFYGFNSEADLS